VLLAPTHHGPHQQHLFDVHQFLVQPVQMLDNFATPRSSISICCSSTQGSQRQHAAAMITKNPATAQQQGAVCSECYSDSSSTAQGLLSTPEPSILLILCPLLPYIAAAEIIVSHSGSMDTAVKVGCWNSGVVSLFWGAGGGGGGKWLGVGTRGVRVGNASAMREQSSLVQQQQKAHERAIAVVRGGPFVARPNQAVAAVLLADLRKYYNATKMCLLLLCRAATGVG
jgi:hypothetical protein